MKRLIRQLRRGWLGNTTSAIIGAIVGGIILAFLTGQLKISPDTIPPSVGAFLTRPVEIVIPFVVLVIVGLLVALLLLIVIAAIAASASAKEGPDGAIGAWVPSGQVMYRADDSYTDEDEVDPDLEIAGPYCLKCQAKLDVDRGGMIAGPCSNPACDVVIAPPVANAEAEKRAQAMVEARWRRLKLEGKEPYLATNRVFGKEDQAGSTSEIQPAQPQYGSK